MIIIDTDCFILFNSGPYTTLHFSHCMKTLKNAEPAMSNENEQNPVEYNYSSSVSGRRSELIHNQATQLTSIFRQMHSGAATDHLSGSMLPTKGGAPVLCTLNRSGVINLTTVDWTLDELDQVAELIVQDQFGEEYCLVRFPTKLHRSHQPAYLGYDDVNPGKLTRLTIEFDSYKLSGSSKLRVRGFRVSRCEDENFGGSLYDYDKVATEFTSRVRPSFYVRDTMRDVMNLHYVVEMAHDGQFTVLRILAAQSLGPALLRQGSREDDLVEEIIDAFDSFLDTELLYAQGIDMADKLADLSDKLRNVVGAGKQKVFDAFKDLMQSSVAQLTQGALKSVFGWIADIIKNNWIDCAKTFVILSSMLRATFRHLACEFTAQKDLDQKGISRSWSNYYRHRMWIAIDQIREMWTGLEIINLIDSLVNCEASITKFVGSVVTTSPIMQFVVFVLDKFFVLFDKTLSCQVGYDKDAIMIVAELRSSISSYYNMAFGMCKTGAPMFAQGLGDSLSDLIDDPELIKGMFGLFFGGLSFLALGKNIGINGIRNFMAAIALVPRASDGMAVFIERSIKILGLAADKIKEALFGVSEVKLASGDPTVDGWCAKVRKMAEGVARAEYDITTENFEEVLQTIDRGLVLLGEYRRQEYASPTMNVITTHLNVLRRVSVPFEKANLSGVRPRVEPIVLYLMGKPGVGKSLAIIPLMIAILRKTLKPELLADLEHNYNNYVYCRMPEQEFWDRYFGQAITVYDDFGQKRDAVGASVSEAMEMIRMSSLFPMPLHMAALEEKGRVNFRSKIIAVTSNLETISTESITSPEAVMRRFGMTFRLVPKQMYCTAATADLDPTERRLDRNHPDLVGRVDLNIHEYHEYKWNYATLTAEPTGTILNVHEFVDKIANELIQHEKFHADFEKVCNSVASNGIPNTIVPEIKVTEPRCSGEIDMVDVMFEQSIGEEEVYVDSDSSEAQSSCSSMPSVDSLYEEEVASFSEYISGYVSVGSRVELAKFLSRWFSAKLKQRSRAVARDASDKLKRLQTVVHNMKKQGIVFITEHVLMVFIREQVSYTLGLAQQAYVDCKVAACRIANKISEHPIVSGIVATLGLITAGVSMYKIYARLGPDVMQSGRPRRNGPRRNDVKKHEIRGLIRTPNDAMVAQFGDANASELSHKLVGSNMYRVTMPWSGEERTVGYITFLRGDQGLMPAHFREIFVVELENDELALDDRIKFYGQKGMFEITVVDLLKRPSILIKEKDIWLISMGPIFPSHRNIIKNFYDGDLEKQTIDMNVELLSLCPRGTRSSRFSSGKFAGPAAITVCDGLQKIDATIGYGIPTIFGDCGSLLVLHNAAAQGKILGFHVGGSGRKGVSTWFRRSYLEGISSQLDGIEKCIELPELDNPTYVGQGLSATIHVVGKAKAAHVTRKSSITKSALHSAWGPAKDKPAILAVVKRGGEYVDPLRLNLSTYCRGGGSITAQEQNAIVSNLTRHFHMNTSIGSDHRDLITFDQAIEGIPGRSFYKPMDRSTSPGYPYVLEKPMSARGKSYWFGNADIPIDYESESLRNLHERVDQIIDDAKRGKMSVHIFLDFPKDETRPIEKVDALKTRCISGAPLDLSVALRMYFQSFCAAIMNNRIDNWIAVGINARSEEWHNLYVALAGFANHFAGDYSEYDKRITCQTLRTVIEIINAWYNDGEDNANVRRVLWESIVNSLHIYEGNLYQWVGCNPSGNALTTILNSIVNIIYLMIGYIKLHPDGLAALPTFAHHVRPIVYGDDNIVSVSAEAAKFFDQVNLARALASIGVYYTNESKTDSDVGFRELKTLTFLKRGFRFDSDQNMYLAPLDINVVSQMPYWTKVGIASLEITKTNVQEALIELSLHGQQTFDTIRDKMVRACIELLDGWYPELTQYAECKCRALTYKVIY